ncbi:hypothetical protein AOLI_G00102320 [Acnodon oligacanthus]
MTLAASPASSLPLDSIITDQGDVTRLRNPIYFARLHQIPTRRASKRRATHFILHRGSHEGRRPSPPPQTHPRPPAQQHPTTTRPPETRPSGNADTKALLPHSPRWCPVKRPGSLRAKTHRSGSQPGAADPRSLPASPHHRTTTSHPHLTFVYSSDAAMAVPERLSAVQSWLNERPALYVQPSVSLRGSSHSDAGLTDPQLGSLIAPPALLCACWVRREWRKRSVQRGAPVYGGVNGAMPPPGGPRARE